MPDIYDLHAKAFKNVCAFVVIKADYAFTPRKVEPARVATIAFKHPADGAGRLYCYLHIFGGPMVRGMASGGGYDKKTASAAHAASKVNLKDYREEDRAEVKRLVDALLIDGGAYWDSCLRDIGLHVYQAV